MTTTPRGRIAAFLCATAMAAAALAMPLAAQDSGGPVVLAADTTGSADERAAAMLAQMTQAEKLSLLMGYFGAPFPPAGHTPPAEARPGSAGYVPGIPRLGIPAQWQTDAGLGVASQTSSTQKRGRTALASGLAIAATWDPQLAFDGGAMIGAEARASGFNVMLAGSVNLMREPRNGRNFEYAGEDPLLAGSVVGAAIAGIQSNQIISTIKHYAVNDQETARNTGNSVLEEGALRMSDLLAFQFAFEAGNPGSVMCAYNRVNGPYSCEHPFLLTQILRTEWNWPGYVLSDWGGVHSTAPSVNAGLDQESGFGLQRDGWFSAQNLTAALESRAISQGRIDEMVHRILRTMFAFGVIDQPVAEAPIDFASHQAIAQRGAEAGIVLLRNEGGLLPLTTQARRIAVIGGHADAGVLSGGGSSQVFPGDGPEGGNAVPGNDPLGFPGSPVYYPSSPLAELRAQLPEAQIDFADGTDPAAAARLAAEADIAIVFVTQWTSEGADASLTLADGQDALVAAIAAARPETVVVVESGGPVLMPWAQDVGAIVEAWYPGRMGGAAIANVLTGAVNPSGHLPATFPSSLDQLPHPEAPHDGDVVYSEGAAVGYRWFDAQGHAPLFAFGHGLSYTQFAHAGLRVEEAGAGLVAHVTVRNTGSRAGADVVQLYVGGDGWEAPRRLGGFARVELAPGQSREVAIAIDPRLLAIWDTDVAGWSRAAGTYRVTLGYSSRDLGESVAITLPALHLRTDWRPGE